MCLSRTVAQAVKAYARFLSTVAGPNSTKSNFFVSYLVYSLSWMLFLASIRLGFPKQTFLDRRFNENKLPIW